MARIDGHNFDLYPVSVSFFTCTFVGKLPLGMHLIPRHVKYETTNGTGRTSVSCISVFESTRPEICRGDIVVRVNETPLLSNLPRDLNSTKLDEFFAECMTALAPTEGPRTLVFLRPMGSTPTYITGMSKNLVLRLDSAAEANLSEFVMAPPEMTFTQDLRAPIEQRTSTPITAPIYIPVNKVAGGAQPSPTVKVIYRTEEEEIEKKVEDELRAIVTASRLAKLKKDEDEKRLRAEQETERIAHLEFIRKEAEDEERRVHELARAQEMMRIEGERRAAEAVRAAEESARQKRVEETVRRRVEEESRRMAEEQEVLMLVEEELNRINEVKIKADHKARVERIAEEAKKRIQAEMERVVYMEEMARIAIEEEALRVQEAAQKRLEERAKYAADEALRLERVTQLHEHVATHGNGTVETEELDESEMSEEAILKAAEKRSREKRVAEEVNKRIVAEKERLLHEIEKHAAEDEERALSKKANFVAAPSPVVASASVAHSAPGKVMSAEEKIRSDAVMESWLQNEVKKRTAEEVRKRIESVKEHSYEARASHYKAADASPEQYDTSSSTAVLFETVFQGKQPMGLILIPHSVLFTNPQGEVKSICCCMVSSSAFTSDIEQGDIAVSINNLSLMNLASAKVSASSNFDDAKRIIQQASVPRTVRFFRAERTVLEDGSTSSLSYSEATMMIQNQVQ